MTAEEQRPSAGMPVQPVGLPELTNEASLLPPAPLLAPVSQSNTSTSAATAAAESHVTRITVPVPEHNPSVGQDATAVQAAEATALSTQTFVGNTSARVVQADAPTSATNAAPAAASVGSTGAVAQSNDASATSTSTAASDAVQSVLQGELFGSTVGAIPTVAQHLDVTQFAVAQSSSIQTDAQNIAVVDLSPGMFVGVTQANEASGTASAEDTATTYQGSEQAQAESSTRQTISQAATIAQAGSAVAAVAQAGVANTAVVEAARPIAAARETTTLVAPALRPATLVTQVNTSQADASVASSQPHRADRCSARALELRHPAVLRSEPTSLSSHRQRQRQTRQEARTSSSPTSSSRRSLPSAQSRRRISIWPS